MRPFEAFSCQFLNRRWFQYSLRTLLLFSMAIALSVAGMTAWIENRSHGKISLHEAASRGDFREVKWLLDHGADVNEMDHSDTPLIYATGWGHTKIVQYLVSRGADVNRGRDRGRSALLQAICNHHVDLAKWLIAQGADVNVKDSEGDTALHYVAHYGNAELAELLIAKGAAVDVKGAGGRTPLYTTVAFRGRFDCSVARVLLEHGADPNIPSNEAHPPGSACPPHGMASTPLAHAVYYHYQEMIELLLKFGAKQVYRGEPGCSARPLGTARRGRPSLWTGPSRWPGRSPQAKLPVRMDAGNDDLENESLPPEAKMPLSKPVFRRRLHLLMRSVSSPQTHTTESSRIQDQRTPI